MSPANSVPFAEHVSELRKRLMWILLFVFIGGVIGYVLNDRLMQILQQPLHDSLYYNTPAGAFSFVMKLCVVFGLVVALPALSYHIFGFFGPIIPNKTKRATVLYLLMSVTLACLGMAFAYFVSLPASLHFLTTFGDSGDIHALITANEYFNFVLTYVAGFAILFQVPLIITFTNRVTPLPPKKLLGATRYVIVLSFIVAAIITPTPDPMNQAIMAGPIILLYLLSVCIVTLHPKRLKNRRHERKQAKQVAQPLPAPTPLATVEPIVQPKPPVVVQPVPVVRAVAPTPRPQAQLISDFRPRNMSPHRPRPFVDVTVHRPRAIIQA